MSNETVADIDYKNDPEIMAYWHGTGGWISSVRNAVGDNLAFSLVLSRIAYDLCVVAGPDGAREAIDYMKKILEDEESKC